MVDDPGEHAGDFRRQADKHFRVAAGQHAGQSPPPVAEDPIAHLGQRGLQGPGPCRGALVRLPAGQGQHQALADLPLEDGPARDVEGAGLIGLHLAELLRDEAHARLLVTAGGRSPVDLVLAAPLVAHRPLAPEAFQLQLHPERRRRRPLRPELRLVPGVVSCARHAPRPLEDGGAEPVRGERLHERGAVNAFAGRDRLPVHNRGIGQRRVLLTHRGQDEPQIGESEASAHRPTGNVRRHHGHPLAQRLHRLPVHPAPVLDLLLGQRRPQHIQQPPLQVADRLALPQPVRGMQRGTDQHVRVPLRRKPLSPRPGGCSHQRVA